MKKLLKAILIILVLIALVLVALNIRRYLKSDSFKYRHYQQGRDYFLESPEDYETDTIELLKSEASDVEGMTRYDKKEAGLSPYLVDTDGDGLTDSEELALGSEPALASTSGDLYPDGYKFLHDMDIHQTYDYAGDATIYGITTDDISVEIKSAEDWRGYADNVTVDPRYRGIYKIYRISGFKGIVTIDLTSVLNENGVTMDDIGIYCRGFFDQGKLEKCKYYSDGAIIRFDTDFGQETKYVYIVDKDDYDVDVSEIAEGRAIMFGSPLMRHLNDAPYSIWYAESGDATLDEYVLSRMKAEASLVTEDYLRGEVPISAETDDIQIKTVSELDIRYKLMQTLLPMFECDCYDNMKFYQLLYYYSDYSQIQEHDVEVAKLDPPTSDYNARTKFDFTKDILPFENFGSRTSWGGNCAGIATLTARTYNGNYIPASGSYYLSKDISDEPGMVYWDISGDDENKTLMDAGLSDYKYPEFVVDHRQEYEVVKEDGTPTGKKVQLLDNGLTPGEEQFRSMIACYWAEYNETVFGHSDRRLLPHDVKYNTVKIDSMKAILDQNKILIAAFRSMDLGGHAVNIVGYKDLPNGNTIFYIYDNNFPELSDLYVLVQPYPDGTFDYEFQTPCYTFSSLKDGHYFVTCEDDFTEVGYQIWSIDAEDGIREQLEREKAENLRRLLGK